MTILIFFAVVFATIVLAILLERIIHCPILVGFAFFSVFLVIAVVLSSTNLVIVAIVLGIIAFLAAFFDCIFRRSRFFRNNNCLRCDCDDDDDDCDRRRNRRNNCNWNNNCNCNCNCNCNNNDNDDSLAIVNSNGVVIARINGNLIRCRDNDNNNGLLTSSNSDCDCNGRSGRCRR